MVKKVSARTMRRDALRAERDAVPVARAHDSFQNFLFNLGVGTDNPSTSAGYGFNPVTRNRTLLEWIHRGSWLGGVAVDVVADDMTRAGIEFQSQMPPDAAEVMLKRMRRMGVWRSINNVIKWSRLYGGAIGVYLLDGADTSQPLRIDRVGPKQFKGMAVLDRWMVEPSLEELVQEPGPELGKPKFYRVMSGIPLLGNRRVHYTRCLRLTGVQVPFQQQLAENMWGISELERIYDRMIAFDSATQGAAQLVYRAHIRVMRIKGLREAIAAGPEAVGGVTKYLDMMRRFQGIEGLSVIDMDDEFAAHTHSAFSGLSDALVQFGQQLSGALQIPLVRLFGQSPTGLNSTGESDLRMYYDGILQKQEDELRVPLETVLEILAKSEGIALPPNFDFEFKSLWQMTPEQNAEVTDKSIQTILATFDSGLIDAPIALREIREVGRRTGTFTNVTDDVIQKALVGPPPDYTALMAAMNPAPVVAPGAPGQQAPVPPGQQQPQQPAQQPPAESKADKPAVPPALRSVA